MARIPVSVALIPFCDCPAVWLPPEPPNASEAESAPMPIVSVRMPLLNFVSTSEIDGPAMLSGPTLNGDDAVPESRACASTVNVPAPRPLPTSPVV